VVNAFVGALQQIVGPGAPFDNPALWAVLAAVRREFNTTLANSTPTLNPMQTSQDLDDSQVHGTLGAADPDGDTLTFTATAPAHGTVEIDQADGTFTYTPDAGYTGPDSFDVTASDAGAGFHIHAPGQSHTVTATVNVTVAPVDTNHAPVAGDPAYEVDNTDQLTGVVTGHVNVTDPDTGDTVTYTLADPVDPDLGTVDVNATTGAWTFTPKPQARLDAYTLQGVDHVGFTVNATDGKATTGVDVSAPIDAAEAVQTGTIAAGSDPSAIAASGDRLYVANVFDHTVTVIDTTTNTVVDTISVGDSVYEVQDLAVNGDRLYVSNYDDAGTVTVIDTTTNTVVDTITVGSPQGLAASGDRLYVTDVYDNAVVVVDTTTDTVVDTINGVGDNPYHAAASGDRLYVADSSGDGTVTVIDTTTNTVIGTVDHVGDSPSGLAVSGDRLYVTNYDGTVTVIDTTTNTLVDTDPATPAIDRITVGDSPYSLAVSGDRLYVANFSDGTMTIIDTTTNAVVETTAVGVRPIGVAVVGNHIYVTHYVEDGTVSVITSVHNGPQVTPNQDGTVDLALHYGGDGEYSDVSIPDAGEPGAPKYWVVKEQHYDPETGVLQVVLEPTLAAQLIAGQGQQLHDSYTLQATPADSVAPQTFSTFALRAAPMAFAAPAADETGPTAPLPQPPGALLNVQEDAVSVGGHPAGVVVTDKYAYVMNWEQDGKVAVIDADPTSATYNHVVNTITVGDSPLVGALAGNGLYVVNAGLRTNTPPTMTVIDTRDNSIVADAIPMPDGSYAAFADPDGTRVYVTDPRHAVLYVVDTDPASQTYNQVLDLNPNTPEIDGIAVAPPNDANTLWTVGAGTFNTDGTRFYVSRNQINTATSTYDGDIAVIDTDPASATYNQVVDAVDINGEQPGIAAATGADLYAPVWDLNAYVHNPSQPPPSGLSVIDIDPASATYDQVVDVDPSTPEVDGVPVGVAPFDVAVSPDGSVAYVVNIASGTVTVIDTVSNTVITTVPYDSTPSGGLQDENLMGISPDGKQMYISKYADGTVTAVTIV